MKIVVTGNMGCGKSTAINGIRRAFSDYTFFDFDACVANMYKEEAVQWLLDDAFGTHDKAKISDIVHADCDAMERLRAITDAILITAIQKANKEVNIIFDIPLFFEFNDHMRLNPAMIVCITADPATQVERVKKRNGWSDEKIQSILAKQYPQQWKVDRSDLVLHNDFATAEAFEQYAYDTFMELRKETITCKLV